jgi:fatty-acyl-CoA synthase
MPDLALTDTSTTAHLFQHAAIRHADKPALVWDGHTLTYAQFSRELAAMAEALRAHGMRKGMRCCLLAGNRPDALIVTYAAQSLGMSTSALHPIGGEADHRFVLEDCGADILIHCEREFSERAAALGQALPKLKVVPLGSRAGTGLSTLAEPFLGAGWQIDAEPSDISRISYTGGTTGRPKGIVLRHRSNMMAAILTRTAWDWPAEVRFLSVTPLSHAAGTMFLPIALQGGAMYIAPRFTPRSFADAARAGRITGTFLVPTQMLRLLDEPDLDEDPIRAIEMVLYGAAPIAPERLAQWLRRFGPNLVQLYGQAESPNCLTVLPRRLHDLQHPARLASCGLANPGMQIAVLGPDDRPVPDGESGELCARGPSIMEGYWNRPEETQKTLAGNWLHTGDIATRDADGFFYLVGRAKDMIISGGFNVYPKEVEDVIARDSAVAAVAVIGVPDAEWGEAVKACVVPRPGALIDPDRIIAAVKAAKGSVSAPKTVDIVDAIPLTPLGKPDKVALRQRYWGGRTRGIA